VDLYGDNIYTTKKNTDYLTDASKEAGVEVNTEKTKYMLLSHHQNAGQKKKKLLGFSPPANYTNQATAVCRQS
jgi:hypothetical protein